MLEKFLTMRALANRSGGSGGGAISWEDLGSTFGEGFVLAECNTMVEEGADQAVLLDPIDITAGKEYKVNWNGTEYKTTAVTFDMEGVPMVALGDLGLMTTGEPTTGEPFLIMAVPASMVGVIGYGVIILPLDGSVEITLSIMGETETITPIPVKYIPKMYYCIDVPAEDFSLVGQSDNLHCFIDAYDTTELYNVIINFGPIWLQVVEADSNGNVFYHRIQLTMIKNAIPGKWEDMEANIEASGITDMDISSLNIQLYGYDPFKGMYYLVHFNSKR